jgi:hypothetical protein
VSVPRKLHPIMGVGVSAAPSYLACSFNLLLFPPALPFLFNQFDDLPKLHCYVNINKELQFIFFLE